MFSQMKVFCLNVGGNESLIYAAGKQCYSSSTANEILKQTIVYDDINIPKFISKLLTHGHYSPFEHCSITYGIEGISRACSHELVRHRIASYSQQSQRYVTSPSEKTYFYNNYVIPPEIEKNDKAKRIFNDVIEHIIESYENLLALGIKKEDARFILPNAAKTYIVATMNLRELLHFFDLRLASDAQWEIRNLAKEMLSIAYNNFPNVFKNHYEKYLKE